MTKDDKKIHDWKLSYEKSKQKAKEIYSKIGWVRCNALGGDRIAFTRIGFNHLMRKGRKVVIRQLDGANKHFFSVMSNDVVINKIKKTRL